MMLPAKYGPVVAPAVAGLLAAHDAVLVKVGAVVLGLLFGAMWRVGSLASDGKAWREMRTDLTVSLLIGGANAVLALALVDFFEVGVLFAMAIAVVIGATGLRALPEIKDALIVAAKRRLLGDDVALIHPRDEKMEEQVRRMDEGKKDA